MVARNEKSMMKLVRLPILRCTLSFRVRFYESLEVRKMGGKSFKFFEFSNYHKVSRLSNIGLKIGKLTNFILLFSFLATIFSTTTYFYD